ncbi:MAG: hypothetical protein FD129_1903, partial [bacterium]
MMDFLAFLACKLGYCCFALGAHDLAWGIYERASTWDPTSAEAFTWLGYLATLREDYDQALGFYRQCLDLEPDSAYI